MRKNIFTLLVGGGLCLSLLVTGTAYAEGSERVNTIKSKGVFEGTGTGSEDVLFYAEDLTYLAKQIDGMENIVDGLAKQSDADIVYEYHHHIDADGNLHPQEVVYTATVLGGCFVANGHTHDKTGTCPKTPVYRHACDSSCWYEEGYDIPPATSDCPIHDYSPCEHEKPGYVDGQWHHSSNRVIDHYNYGCGSPVNTYKANCGRRENEIMSATITFKPSGA